MRGRHTDGQTERARVRVGGMEGGGLHGVVLITFILQVHITGGDKQYNYYSIVGRYVA